MLIFLPTLMSLLLAQTAATAFADKDFPDSKRHYPIRTAQLFMVLGISGLLWMSFTNNWGWVITTIAVFAIFLIAMRELSAYKTFKITFLRNPLDSSLKR